MSTQSSAVMYSADAGQRYTLYHMLMRGVINNLASVCYNQLHLIAKAQTMECNVCTPDWSPMEVDSEQGKHTHALGRHII